MPKKKISRRFKGLSRMSAKLLALTDTVVETDEIDTCAVAVREGRVELVLGPLFRICKDENAREQRLRHECFHVMLDHHKRQEERDGELWNQVTDCAIHEGGAVDWQLIDKACDIETVTYERLGIPAMPPELAYDWLKRGKGKGPGPGPEGEGLGPAGQPGKGGCGRGKIESDTDEKSKSREAEVVAEVLQSWEAEVEETGFDGGFTDLSNGVTNTDRSGVGRGSGRERPEIYKVPVWVGEVLDRLLERHNARLDRDRTWTREHRYIESGLLPGQKRAKGWEGVWCIDASGSINHQAVNQMMNGAYQTPELAGSVVAVFDDGMLHDELIPVHDLAAIQTAISLGGGGTSITKAARQIDKLAGMQSPKVWLTDAYSSDGLPLESDQELWVLFQYNGITVVDYPRGR